MKALAKPGTGHFYAICEQNRRALRDADVYTVGVVGGPGCGKTTLLDATIARLMPGANVGVIACEMGLHRELPPRYDARIVHVNAWDNGIPDEIELREALRRMDTEWLDLLFIEHVGSLTMRALPDLGQDVTATIFSVAAGDDKADKYPELVRASDVILLNKVDLLTSVPFHLTMFRDDVSRLNPNAGLMEVSALHGNGLDAWIEWLKPRLRHRGEFRQAELGQFFG